MLLLQKRLFLKHGEEFGGKWNAMYPRIINSGTINIDVGDLLQISIGGNGDTL